MVLKAEGVDPGGDAKGLKNPGPSECQVSILQVSAGFETDDDILRAENVWMKKLQSHTMGINGKPSESAMQQLPAK